MRAGMRRLLVVLAVAGAGFVPAPATAAGYCSGSGVSVVVDFGALGGGIEKFCDASGNRNAAQAFENTQNHLSYAQRQPGFVCRVRGIPASDPCVNTSPADAYWGLYWSDGTSGWKYSSVAAGSLTVPAGGSVAFSWQNGGTADPPGTAPAAPPAAQSSAAAPTAAPTRTPAKPRSSATAKAPVAGRASTSASASASPSASGSASATPAAGTSAPPSPSASTPATPSASASTAVAGGTTTARLDDSNGSGDGLPWWLPVGSIVALAGAGGVVWQVRRARA